MTKMDVIVVGGGIGGLSLALSLHQAGIAVRVYEAVRDPAPLGVGINLQPSAVRELTELGLDDALSQTGIATQQLSYFNKFGQLICSEPRGLPAGYRWPQYSIHRGQLQAILLAALRERIGAAGFRSGLKLTAFEQRGERVCARLRDSGSGVELLDDADVLAAQTESIPRSGASSTRAKVCLASRSKSCGERPSRPNLSLAAAR
jgi:5-methylphenazine-1-carboxylate 1-monooxygenase